jgi:ubiquinone/menaquinone biosynthesis C-methylase UbiE
MKLNRLEFLLMNNPIRAYAQEKYELPMLMSMLSATTFSSVLEIGCGNGNGTKLIRKRFEPKHMTAIDLDQKMIKLARDAVRDPQITFQVMDASQLGFANQSFDAIFDFGIIHHIPNWRACIAELRRVLKQGGKLILEEFSIETFSGFPGRIYRSLLAHPYDQMFSIEEFVQYLKDAGFRIHGVKTANPFKIARYFWVVASAE